MPMIDGDWTVDRATGNIRYVGFDHSNTTTVAATALVTGDYYQIRSAGDTDWTSVGAANNNVGTRFEATGTDPATTGVATQAASYATVIQFHRWIGALADDPEFAGDDEHDIIDKEATARSTDNIITLQDYTASGGVKYNITATEIEHLYDGSITQGSGPTQEIWDGIVNFGNFDAHIQVKQDGAILSDDYWNAGWQAGSHSGATDNTILTDSTASWTTDEWVGYWIKNVTDGSVGEIVSNTATTITVDDLYGGTSNDWVAADVYNIQVPINPDAGQGISHRFMIKTREDGVDIDRRRLLGQNRRYGKTYGEFSINGTSRGNNVLALSDSDDLNNTTPWVTIDALTDITNTEGLRLIDIDGNGANEEYYSEWTRGAQSINTFFEYLKHTSADTTTETLQGENGELHRGITHYFAYDAETGAPTTATNDKHVFGTLIDHGAVTSGPFQVGEAVHEDTATPVWKGRVLAVDTVNTSLVVDVEFGTVGATEAFTGQTSGAQATTGAAPTARTTAGEFKVLAFDDDGTSGNFYGQLTKGVAPVDDQPLYDATDHTDFYTINGAPTAPAVSTPFVGVSTGSALIGAHGLGMVAGDTASADTFFDLQGNVVNPPNNVTMTASGFISGDYVLVTEKDAGSLDINFTQLASTGSLTATNVTTVPVAVLPTDTPSTAGTKGSIRIERANGLYSLHRYTAIDTAADEFTIPTTDFSSNNATHPFNVFIGYLDYTASGTSDTFSYVYSSDRDHFMRVRDGGATPIKTAEAEGAMTSTGGTISVNRIDDT
jgi:hypothetical protein